jgi:exonuclease III
MNFLFWNINKKDLTNEIVELVEEHQIDVLVLIECEISNNQLLDLLNHKDIIFKSSLHFVKHNRKISFFFKDDLINVKEITDERRYLAKQLSTDNNIINLVIVHYQSKLNWRDDDQYANIYELKEFIKKIEGEYQNDKTLLIGDFNMNPFEKGMAQTTGLHAVMDRNIALKKNRIVDDRKYEYFYNPMWSFFGENGKGKTHGTYYYQAANPICYFWNIFDQVLLRPSLIDFFDDDDLEIITEINGKSLLDNNGIIDKKNFSDHLPVKFTLKF